MAVSVGAEVRAARLAAGLTIEDVSGSTRVRSTVIERIEQDDFSLCGGTVYARGHLRAICAVVGLAAEPILRQFDALYAESTAPVLSGVIADESEQERRQINWTAVMSGALVLLLAFAVVRFVTAGRSSSTGTPAPPAVAATPQPSPPTSPGGVTPSVPGATSGPGNGISGVPGTPLPSDAVAAGPAVQLVLTTTTGRSWVQVTGSKSVLFSGILEKGTSRRFTDATKISLIVGNSAVVTLKVNGVDLGPAGTAGQVARLSFGPGNPTQG